MREKERTQRHSPGVLAHNQIIGPVVGLTLRAVHPTRRCASGEQQMRRCAGASAPAAFMCACRHSTFERMLYYGTNYFLAVCEIRVDDEHQLSS